jgi:hypothetical protein
LSLHSVPQLSFNFFPSRPVEGERLECWWKIPYNRGRRCVSGILLAIRSRRDPVDAPFLSPEQAAEADRLFRVLRPALEDELRRLTQLLASKADDQLLGKTEFEVRDLVHTIGAKAIETALNERKKGGIKAPA